MDHTEELGESQVKDLLFQAIGFLDATGIRAVGTRAPDTVRKILRDAKKLFEYPGTQTRIIWHLPTDESLSRDENLEKRQKWRAMIDALQAAGFVLSMDIKKGWVRTVLDSFTDIETIGWSLEKGLLKEPVLHRVAREREGHTDAHGLVMSLRKEGSAEFCMLERLRDAGLAGGAAPLFGITDLVCAGLLKCARHLFDLGERPEQGRATTQGLGNGLGPIEAYLASLSPRGSSDKKRRAKAPEDLRKKARGALDGLRALVGFGAVLSADMDSPPCAWDKDRSAAFARLVGAGVFFNERAVSAETLQAVGEELIALGADVNGGDNFAGSIAWLFVNQDCWGDGHDGFGAESTLDWALKKGLDLSKHASAVHTIAAQNHRKEKGWGWPLAEKFEGLGAKIATIGPNDPSPVRMCLVLERWENARKFIAAGAPMNYVNENGEGALHFLAGFARKEALAILPMFLSNPGILALLELPSRLELHEGETPLHKACAVLNQPAMELLLAAGANPNAQDAKGWTPLRHLLRKTGEKAQLKAAPLVRLLVERGADPSIRDAKGLTAAQSVAKKAPLGALAELLALRPEDVASGSEAAIATKEKLRNRGGEGLALAEQVDLAQEMAKSRMSDAASDIDSENREKGPALTVAPKRRAKSL